ncbi:MAG: TlpA disulfide reductase family protein [Planctomycetales bacterium]
MIRKSTWRCGTWEFAITAAILAGCGGARDAPETAAAARKALPPASISGPGPAEPEAITAGDARPVPEKGSPEWLLEEIVRVRVEPFPQNAQLKEIAEAQARRNRKIIVLASDVVAKTHDDPQRSAQFAGGVHHLMEARLQLALHGEREHIDALYDDAASLFERAPESAPAAEAAFAVARFAHTNARRFARNEPQWLEEFVRQAKFYATSFPQDEPHAAPLLCAAGRSCELNGMADEAVNCYALLQKQFPENPQGKEAVGVLRRLELPGRTLELAGPTIDGGTVNIADYRGRVVLVVFWSTTARGFIEQIDALQAEIGQHPPEALTVVGVNLDEDEGAIDAFLEQHRLTWKQIFHARPEQRGWNNPIAQHYGVRDVPLFWLVDRQGKVVSTTLTAATLPAAVARVAGQPAAEPRRGTE